MKRVLKKVTAALLAATMVVGLAACGNGGSSDDKSSKSSKSGKVKIGVSIWSSTDVLGSQCKKMLDAAAKALDVDVQYVDQGASRRSLGRVSVPMWPVTLSGRLLIVALVGRYPANWLIRRGSIPYHRSFSHRIMRSCALMRY